MNKKEKIFEIVGRKPSSTYHIREIISREQFRRILDVLDIDEEGIEPYSIHSLYEAYIVSFEENGEEIEFFIDVDIGEETIKEKIKEIEEKIENLKEVKERLENGEII